MRNRSFIALLVFLTTVFAAHIAGAAPPEVYSYASVSNRPAVEIFSVRAQPGTSSDFEYSIKTFRADSYQLSFSCPPGIQVPDGSGTDLCGAPRLYPAALNAGSFRLTNFSSHPRTVVVSGQVVDTYGVVIDSLDQTVTVAANPLAATSTTPGSRTQQNSTPTTFKPITVDVHTATLGGYYPVTTGYIVRYLEWGETLQLGYATSRTTSVMSGQFVDRITGLRPHTTYYYRAVTDATDDGVGDHFYGQTLSFTTPGPEVSPSLFISSTPQVNSFGYQTCLTYTTWQSYRAVSALQEFLLAGGYFQATPTGFFGPATRRAVQAFQSDQSISPTGFMGPITTGRIRDLSCGS